MDKYSIFKRRKKLDKGSYEGNITKQNDLKKTAKNILLCYFAPIFFTVILLEIFLLFYKNRV